MLAQQYLCSALVNTECIINENFLEWNLEKFTNFVHLASSGVAYVITLFEHYQELFMW